MYTDQELDAFCVLCNSLIDRDFAATRLNGKYLPTVLKIIGSSAFRVKNTDSSIPRAMRVNYQSIGLGISARFHKDKLQ
jgi:hypothetical protein